MSPTHPPTESETGAGEASARSGSAAARRGADTRERILEVAERTFAWEGFAGAHLQAIAEEVGVQKTALYYYYPSKAALYEAVLLRILAQLDATLREVLERDEPPAERLEHLVMAMNDLLAERSSASKILVRIWVDRVRIEEARLRPAVEQPLARLLTFLREGVDAGVFVRMSSRNLFQTLLGAIVFHYATGEFGARVLGVESLFEPDAVAWRRRELQRLVRRGLLRERRGDAEDEEA